MKRFILFFIIAAFVSPAYYAQTKNSTPKQAEEWVKKAIAFYKEAGAEKAFKEFNNPKGKFTRGDLYIIVYDLDGKCLAQGSDPAAVGKNRMDLKDADGKMIVKDRIEIAKTKGKGWQNYKWANPATKNVEAKTVYVEKVGKYVFACGAYSKK